MILRRYRPLAGCGRGLLVIEHRAEIAHIKTAFMKTEIEPCQSDGHGKSGFMTHGINSALLMVS